MTWYLPSRLCLGTALAALLSAAPAPAALWRAPQPAPPVVAKPKALPARPPARNPRAAARQEHLEQWMERHSNLTLPDQLHALENEPGFRESPPQTQQRLRDELVRLYNMSPQQRTRILEGNEALERMTQQQRQQFNSSVQQFRSLAPDRKRMVTVAFRNLRPLSQGERLAIINSDRFRDQFSDHERDVLRDLLLFEPYFAAQGPTEGP